MLDRFTAGLQFHGQALALRAERQQVLASNIANADTPNYQARELDFSNALRSALASPSPAGGGAAGGAGRAPVLSVSTAAMASQGRASSSAQLPLRLADSEFAGRGAGTVTSTMSRNADLLWRVPDQPSIDGNTVDLDRERASFADNSLRYEATLRFIDGNVRGMLSAIRGE